MIAPNGIVFSPDRKTLYMTDSAAGVSMIEPLVPLAQVPMLQYNSTNRRTLYAFDVSSDGRYLINQHPLHTAMNFVPDSLNVASNDYIITGAGHSIDIPDASGTPLVRIQINFTAVNFDVVRAQLNMTGPV